MGGKKRNSGNETATYRVHEGEHQERTQTQLSNLVIHRNDVLHEAHQKTSLGEPVEHKAQPEQTKIRLVLIARVGLQSTR